MNQKIPKKFLMSQKTYDSNPYFMSLLEKLILSKITSETPVQSDSNFSQTKRITLYKCCKS